MKRLFKNSNFIFAILTFLNIYLFFKNFEPTFSKIKCNDQFLSRKSEIRDFYRYDCKHLKRIGGFEKFVKLVPHDLYRYNQSKTCPFIFLDNPAKNHIFYTLF